MVGNLNITARIQLSIPYRILTIVDWLYAGGVNLLSIPYRILTELDRYGIQFVWDEDFQFPTGFSRQGILTGRTYTFAFQFPTGFSRRVVKTSNSSIGLSIPYRILTQRRSMN